jgi:predicted DNA binding protein
MYEAEIHLRQDKHCVVSELSEEFGTTFDVEIEELHNGDVTFILDSGRWTDGCLDRLAAADSVEHHERIGDDQVLVTKPSCSAYSAVVQNHGTLRRVNSVSHRRRVYNVLAVCRENLRDILGAFRRTGTVTLGRLEEVGDSEPVLTGRQLEVVQYALESGYYDWPREDTSAELADDLGISRPTFLEHLRKAESKLLAQAVDRETERH